MAKGPLWDHFFDSCVRQNSSHNKAYCYGCIDHHWPAHIPIDLDRNLLTYADEQWFKDGTHVL